MSMKEVRRTITLPMNLRLREAGEGEEQSRILEGYACKWGEKSEILGWYYPYREILEPGCMTDEMLREQRVYFTLFHNREAILGRWDKGEGTLKLTLDNIGMKVECEAPHTGDGDKAIELAKRGDLTEMSFAYSTDEEDTENCVSMEKTDEKTDEGIAVELRHVKRILNVYDVTIAANPAYMQTEIKAREQERQQRELEEKKKNLEESADEEAARIEREKEKAARKREATHLRKIASAVLS